MNYIPYFSANLPINNTNLRPQSSPNVINNNYQQNPTSVEFNLIKELDRKVNKINDDINNKIKIVEKRSTDETISKLDKIFSEFRGNLTKEISVFVSSILSKKEFEFSSIQKNVMKEIEEVKNEIRSNKRNYLSLKNKIDEKSEIINHQSKKIKCSRNYEDKNTCSIEEIQELTQSINDSNLFDEVSSNFDTFPVWILSEDEKYTFVSIDQKYIVIPLNKTFHNLIKDIYPNYTSYMYQRKFKDFIPFEDYIECKMIIYNRKQICKLITGKGLLKLAFFINDKNCITEVINIIKKYNLVSYFKPLEQLN
jgi:hypothetical protein